VDAETAWAAGLFEGEGSVFVREGRLRLSVKMVEGESVRRFAAAVGGGKVYGPYPNRMGEKDGYPRRDYLLWVAEGDEARRILELLRPLLSSWRVAAVEPRAAVA